jgi:hypothetical protein
MTNPDSSPNEEEPLEAELPGWDPSRRDRPDPLDPAHTTVTTDPTDDETTAGWDRVIDDAVPLDEPAPSSTTRSSPGSIRRVNPEVAAAAAGMFVVVANIVGMILDRTVGRSSRVWLLREHEAWAIAEPLGRIAARHAPIGDGQASDAADAIEAGVAGVAYAARATVESYGLGPEPPQSEGPSPNAEAGPWVNPYQQAPADGY